MSMSILGKALLLIGLAFIAATAISTYTDTTPEQREDLIQQFKEEPLEASKTSLAFAVTYDTVTPTHTTEWLPPNDKTTWFWEETPTLDKTDAPVLVLAWFIFLLISRYIINPLNISGLKKTALVIGLFVIGTILVLYAWKTYAYNVFLNSAEELGIQENVLSARALVMEETKETFIFWAAVGAFSFLVLCRSIWGAVKN